MNIMSQSEAKARGNTKVVTLSFTNGKTLKVRGWFSVKANSIEGLRLVSKEAVRIGAITKTDYFTEPFGQSLEQVTRITTRNGGMA